MHAEGGLLNASAGRSGPAAALRDPVPKLTMRVRLGSAFERARPHLGGPGDRVHLLDRPRVPEVRAASLHGVSFDGACLDLQFIFGHGVDPVPDRVRGEVEERDAQGGVVVPGGAEIVDWS